MKKEKIQKKEDHAKHYQNEMDFRIRTNNNDPNHYHHIEEKSSDNNQKKEYGLNVAHHRKLISRK